MARPKGKTAAKSTPAKTKATPAVGAEMSVKPQSTGRSVRRFAISKLIHAQTAMLMFGVTLPLSLIWVGSWLIFTLPKLLQQIDQYVKSVGTTAPAIYANTLLPLYGSNNGLAYVIIGIVAYILAVVIFWFVFRKLNLNNLALGELRVRSIALTLIVFFIITAVVVSLANTVLFDSLLALSSGA